MKKHEPSLNAAIARTFRWPFGAAGLFKLLHDILTVADIDGITL